MKSVLLPMLSILAFSFGGCSAGAPPVPMGLDRRPANSAKAAAGLIKTGDYTPLSLSSPETPKTLPYQASAPMTVSLILSDYYAPAGLMSMPSADRERLIISALKAQTYFMSCRSDNTRTEATNRQASLHRGVSGKGLLVGQGVRPDHIGIFGRSAGGFIANNASAAGRAKNRRVVILSV